jgi:hypothetical protein
MELVLVLILCMTILNVLPWILLCFKRPDMQIKQQLAESDSALAQLIQIIMSKMDELQEMGDIMASPAQNFDLGSIIAQIIQGKMNGTNDNDYIRSPNGQFNGPQENDTIEAKNLNETES